MNDRHAVMAQRNFVIAAATSVNSATAALILDHLTTGSAPYLNEITPNIRFEQVELMSVFLIVFSS